MEVIELHGYTDSEKMHIARQDLVPKSLEENVLKKNQAKINDSAIRFIVARYARESGVRNLESKWIQFQGRLPLKSLPEKPRALRLTTKNWSKNTWDLRLSFPENAWKTPSIGVANGFGSDRLRWRSADGRDNACAGQGRTRDDGYPGEVMKESASIAYSLVRKQAEALKLEESFFEKNQIHMHVRAGCNAKRTGPSAGVTLVASMYSLISETPLKNGIGHDG
jgi:ATP-dependent Lon protease